MTARSIPADRGKVELLLAQLAGRGELPLALELAASEWDKLVALAVRLGVAGHVHRRLAGDVAWSRVPPACRMRLVAMRGAIAARNAQHLATLAEVLTALDGAGVPAIVLKGAALVERVYGDLSVRTMSDVDLLVERDRLDAATDALDRLGFAADEWFRPRAWWVEHSHHLVPYRRGSVTVELHHGLLPPTVSFAVAPAELWERAEHFAVAGVRARALGVTHNIVHLALHLAVGHHFESALSGLRDIAEVCAHAGSQVDWEGVERAGKGNERAMWAALTLARELSGAAVPQEATDALVAAGTIGLVERRALRRVAMTMSFAVGTAESAALPLWLPTAWTAALLEDRGWTRRIGRVGRRAIEVWTDRSRDEGHARWAALHGIAVQPFRGLLRRFTRQTRHDRG